MKKKVRLCRREINEQIKFPTNISPLLRKIYSSRGISSADELKLDIESLLPWQKFSGIEKAVNILYESLCAKIKIVVVGDFDADGATSIALSILSMRALGFDNITYIIPNRFKDGYGLSPEIVDRANANGAQMIMTVDNGISSYSGVDYACNLGIPVLITDHHLPGNRLPAAEVIVNPNLSNCSFPSKFLSGVGVVFYLMLALHNFLFKKNWFKINNINSLTNPTSYLDLVAIGTVVDLVPLDFNNRILIWQGLNLIRMGKCRLGVRTLLNIAKCNSKKLTANDLGFIIGPRLNAAGRIEDMSISVSLLLCENVKEAQRLASKLNRLNRYRKEIEQQMQIEALEICNNLEKRKTYLPVGLTIYKSNWHQGIIGILASRIKERFNRPVIAFAPSIDGILKGSGRSIQGLHMYSILERLDTIYPNLILKFGGHAMAVGLLLKEINFHEFQYYFNNLVTKSLDPSLLEEIIISDGSLKPEEITLEVAQMLKDAGPWGQMFPEPIFDGYFYLLQQKIINNRHLKVKIKSVEGGPTLDGIIFDIDISSWPNDNIYKVKLAYKLDINEFKGNCNLQIIINSIWPV